MIRTFIAAFYLSAVVIAAAAEVNPPRPTPAQIAQILGIDEGRVSAERTDKHPKLSGKGSWLANYKISTGKGDCGLTITLIAEDRIKTDFLEKIAVNQKDFQKITRDDGTVIYHVPGDYGVQKTFYITTLINHKNDWDISLMLSREPDADDSKLPFVIATDGIKLICKVEAVLKKQEAQVQERSATK